jgi:hypothetical protein
MFRKSCSIFSMEHAQLFESERLLFDQRVPSGGQTLKTKIASRGIAHGLGGASLTVFGTKTR